MHACRSTLEDPTHRRSYSNRLSRDQDIGNGANWLIRQWAYLARVGGGSVVVVRGQGDVLWFDPASGGYAGRYGSRSSLTHDAAAGLFRLSSPGGEEWAFHDFGQFVSPPGLFARHETAGGQVTEVAAYDGDHVADVRRTVTEEGVTTTESFLYDYYDAAEDAEQAGRLEAVTLRRQEGDGPWAEVGRAEYEYYGPGDAHGTLGDLKRVRLLTPGPAGREELGTHYYRYWTAADGTGFPHGLKYVLEPQSYAALAASITDPLAATDAQVAELADYYFEYDGQRRVVRETIQHGRLSYTFAYAASGFADGYNAWSRRTVEGNPDGSEHVVYANFLGQVLVKELRAGADRWVEHYAYDAEGRQVLYAPPSAVSGYDDAEPDLAVTLKADAGPVRLTEYYDGTGGGPAGYVKAEKLRRGAGGTPVLLRAYEYASHTAGGRTVHPISKTTVYRNEDGTGAVETSYAYAFHEGTVQIASRVTTLPAVPAEQNGSGVAATAEEVFDLRGNILWRKDERGAITGYEYDPVTDALVRRTEDVDTARAAGVPAGWATVTGWGTHLVTDYEHDDRGRTVRTLGPEHEAVVDGAARIVRTADWTLYLDAAHETRSARGYLDVAAGTYATLGPVSIVRRDERGNVLERVQAVRSSEAGEPTVSEGYPRASYVAWTAYDYTDCCRVAAERVYHDIPASGEGLHWDHYARTSYGYDTAGRRNKTVTPGGTVTRVAFDARGNAAATWVGTNDSGATDADPAGGGHPDNDLVVVAGRQYDGGTAGGDGLVTAETSHVDDATTRVTAYAYDWRNRQVDSAGEEGYFERRILDNLGRVVRTDRHDGSAAGRLLTRSETLYDDLGRAYRAVRYGVDPGTGAVGHALVSDTWFDEAGNAVKNRPMGSTSFTKSVYDGLHRLTVGYIGCDLDEAGYADALSVADDAVLVQMETDRDSAGNAIAMRTRLRYHDATGDGHLGSPSSVQPKARVSYAAAWFDPAGRQVAVADFGTNGGAALTRPGEVPKRSDLCLVSETVYDQAGRAVAAFAVDGREDRSEYDAAGRRVTLIENYRDGLVDAESSGEDRTTRWTYTPDGRVATLTVVNPATRDQETVYVYGTTLADSGVARSDLKRAEIHPDSDDVSRPLGDGSDGFYDRVEFRYDRTGTMTEVKDQNGTVHAYAYDRLGRPVQDRVTRLGIGIDGAVRRIETAYNARGLRTRVTSYDDPAVGSGTVLNEVRSEYNGFGQLTREYQAADGAVDNTTVPSVAYVYAEGTANTTRQTGLTYPNGRMLTYDHDDAGRVISIMDAGASSSQLVGYSYLGGAVAEVKYPEPQLRHTLAGTDGTSDADTGDQYKGLDRFGRIKDARWRNDGKAEDVVRTRYGHDRSGNRVWREDVVAAGQGKNFDELYAYDGLARLTAMSRGELNAGKTALTVTSFVQAWDLDPTGNWSRFRENADGDGAWALDQTRVSNAANEISNLSEMAGPSWVDPAYDPAGNMIMMPQPTDPTAALVAVYDAWNRLVTLTDPTTGHTLQEDAYDGRRFRIVRKSYSGGTLSETRRFYYTAGWQAVEERVEASTAAERQFVWGFRYVDDLVSCDRDTDKDAVTDERLYVLQDVGWNVVALSDAAGDVSERFVYNAYGESSSLTAAFLPGAASVSGWDILLCGYRRDPSGMYGVRNRAYNPRLGAWVSRDPIGHHGEPSLYLAWPAIGRVDPFGLKSSRSYDVYEIDRNDKRNYPGPWQEFVIANITVSIATDSSGCRETPEKCEGSVDVFLTYQWKATANDVTNTNPIIICVTPPVPMPQDNLDKIGSQNCVRFSMPFEDGKDTTGRSADGRIKIGSVACSGGSISGVAGVNTPPFQDDASWNNYLLDVYAQAVAEGLKNGSEEETVHKAFEKVLIKDATFNVSGSATIECCGKIKSADATCSATDVGKKRFPPGSKILSERGV